jgi:NAD(P)-dependent dehydrogenase (short-subunit alcohol dehydrogenase family)
LAEQGVQQEMLDLGSDASIADLSQRLEGVQLDLLVHNAGISINDDLAHLDAEALARQYRVNALGPLLLTSALMGNLSRGAKVVIVSSRMGSLGHNQTGRQYGYRASKAAVNMIGVNLSRDLAPHGIAVGILHPGFVRTGMTRGRGERSPEEAARGLLARIGELNLASSGSFWHADGRTLSW